MLAAKTLVFAALLCFIFSCCRVFIWSARSMLVMLSAAKHLSVVGAAAVAEMQGYFLFGTCAGAGSGPSLRSG